ncbi:MAG: hypothetical protein KAI66_07585, partial [Lentisphaeria bacterium]|nr:hypothetical protein [Lentisphaeria bacterium]
ILFGPGGPEPLANCARSGAGRPGPRAWPANTATEPKNECGPVVPWAPCTPKSVGGFSAAGYFFGRKLHQELGVPIGLINSSWSGTAVEAWTPWEFQKDDPVAVQIRESWDKREAEYTPEKAQARFDEQMTKYKTIRQEWADGGKQGKVPRRPRKQEKPRTYRNYPCNLYNAMIHPLAPYALRGAIWYQGEANSGRGKHYEVMLTNLIASWRAKWGSDFPFYFVQLPNFTQPWTTPVQNSGWADIRESFMNVAKKVPGTGMAITIDVGEADNIHPKNKQDVGDRLARLALHDTYGKTGFSRCGPVPQSCDFQGSRAIVTFDTGGSPLAIKDGGELVGFALTGLGGKSVRAQASILGDNQVVVTSPEMKEPFMVHYAWAPNPVGVNLFNKDGLPATPFRFGEIPPLDCFAKMLPEEAAAYKLVYAFDPLNGRTVNGNTSFVYPTDNSAKITTFRKIAYFLALQNLDGTIRYAFVSMDPFTDDVSKIGVPAKATGARFQQNVTGALVKSNAEGIVTGAFAEGCNIEFWDCNYGGANAAKVPNASSALHDFGDQMSTAKSPGYGCMQIHNWQAKQCVICFNKFSSGRNADLGIGNSPGPHPDWTFSSSGKTYSRAEFKVLVLP